MTGYGGAPDPTWPFVRTLLCHDELDSTSDRAAELVREGVGELPLAVRAKSQTRGRGRGSHTWWSDAGSLTFTLAIDPAAHGLKVESEPKLALAAAVAVVDAVNQLTYGSPSIGIRWPNDIEVDGRKVGGILPERIEIDTGHRILIGIGINVTTNLADAPAEVRGMATSLAESNLTARGDDLIPRLLAAILRHFESALRRLVEGDPELAARWNRLDQLRDRWISVDLGTRVISGWGRGIDADGALLLDDGDETHRLFGGQVLR